MVTSRSHCGKPHGQVASTSPDFPEFDRNVVGMGQAKTPSAGRNEPFFAPDLVKAAVFDIGGVFLYPNYADVEVLLAELGVVLSEQLVDNGMTFYRKAHHAGVAAVAAVSDLKRTDGIPEHTEQFWSTYDHAYHAGARGRGSPDRSAPRAIRTEWTWPHLENIQAFHRLVDGGLPVAIVSNNDGSAVQQMADHGVCQVGAGPLPTVPVIVDSGVLGVSKPDPPPASWLLPSTPSASLPSTWCTWATPFTPTSSAPPTLACRWSSSTPSTTTPATTILGSATSRGRVSWASEADAGSRRRKPTPEADLREGAGWDWPRRRGASAHRWPAASWLPPRSRRCRCSTAGRHEGGEAGLGDAFGEDLTQSTVGRDTTAKAHARRPHQIWQPAALW